MKLLSAILASCALITPLRAASYYWDSPTGGPVGGSGPWDNSSILWHSGSTTGPVTFWPVSGGNNDAFLLGPAGSVNNMTVTMPTIYVNDIVVNTDPAGSSIFYNVVGPNTLWLDGSASSIISVADGNSTLTVSSILVGNSGFRKTGPGTVFVDGLTDNLTGGITVSGGTLTAGTGTNSAGNVALRSNDITLGPSTTVLNAAGGNINLSIGGLQGSGTVSLGNGLLSQMVLTNMTFDGRIVSFGLTVQGAATQTYNNQTNVAGNVTLYGVSTGIGFTTAGITLSGLAALASIPELDLQGGRLNLDNLPGNTTLGPVTDRLSDSARIVSDGGTMSLVGNATWGSMERVGQLSLAAGQTTVNAVHNGGSGDTVWRFSGLNQSYGATIDFTDTGSVGGSTLGGTPVSTPNPRVQFGAIPPLSPGGFLGEWATVNGSDYAKYDPARGVFAPDASSPYDIISAAPVIGANPFASEYETLDQTAPVVNLIGGTHSVQGFRINPMGPPGQALDLQKDVLETGGILLAGTNDYLIYDSSGGSIQMSPFTKGLYIGVADANTTLSINTQIFSPFGGNIIKYGDGFLDLLTDNSASITSDTAFVINAGTLRATLGPTGSLPSNNFTSVVFRGGVLEIAGGGAGTGSSADFVYGLGSGPNTVNWQLPSGSAAGLIDQGSGGFSAYGSDATVNIGGASATLTWNTKFFVQNGHALVFGSTQSDALLTFENPINLDGTSLDIYHAREFRVIDNPGSTTDFTRLSGAISGGIRNDLLKTGDGTLQLTAASKYQGNTIVHQGTLQIGANGGTGAGNGFIAGTAKVIVNSGGTLLLGGTTASTNRINNGASVVLNGGTFNTDGLSEATVSGPITPGLGVLTLSASSVIDLGTTPGTATNTYLAFSGSADEQWLGTLSIWNYSGTPVTGGGIDQLYFGINTLGLTTAQLGQISFYSGSGTGFLGTGVWATPLNGEVTYNAIPEPSTVLAGLALVGLIGFRERRRIAGWIERSPEDQTQAC